jgi:hypothetical protein
MLGLPDLDPAIANAAFLDLRASVTWLFDDSDARRSARHYALASVEELCPASPMEARLAVQVVVSDIHATDCLHDAAEHRDDEKRARQCRSQASAMQRYSHRALHKLEQMQQARRLRDAAKAAIAGPYRQPGQQTPALTAAATVATAAVATTAAAGPDPAPAAPGLSSAPAAAQPPASLPRAISEGAVAKAETFATRNRMLAMCIRRAGGLTPQSTAGFRRSELPSDLAVVEALVHGTTTILRLLDCVPSDVPKAA